MLSSTSDAQHNEVCRPLRSRIENSVSYLSIPDDGEWLTLHSGVARNYLIQVREGNCVMCHVRLWHYVEQNQLGIVLFG
jgi:hypothetical protein